MSSILSKHLCYKSLWSPLIFLSPNNKSRLYQVIRPRLFVTLLRARRLKVSRLFPAPTLDFCVMRITFGGLHFYSKLPFDRDHHLWAPEPWLGRHFVIRPHCKCATFGPKYSSISHSLCATLPFEILSTVFMLSHCVTIHLNLNLFLPRWDFFHSIVPICSSLLLFNPWSNISRGKNFT